ncbi:MULTISPECIES: IS66 family insertion sequence element accessory protein TnpB [unclassified Mesorhizobium]|uniref:IS66 family insertion sequence element accessory protein TnpB n=1 Tax=unclassified Mesorhizobium TaxID=325217 RepID=UPI003335A173
MIPVPSQVRIWLAVGRTDMRRGMQGLALQVQETLGRDPHLCVGRDYVAEPSWCQPRPAGPDFSAT